MEEPVISNTIKEMWHFLQSKKQDMDYQSIGS